MKKISSIVLDQMFDLFFSILFHVALQSILPTVKLPKTTKSSGPYRENCHFSRTEVMITNPVNVKRAFGK
jgi:hypothetical protein